MSHRNKEYAKVWNNARDGFRKLLGISADYQIYFMQGGASLQFSGIPMNFAGPKKAANFLVTGVWSDKAAVEAANLIAVNKVWVDPPKQYYNIIGEDKWKINPDASYFHYCSNETINGLTYFDFPYSKIPSTMPIVCDMSSEFCSRPIDVSKYGVIFAGAQKNCGPAGNTVVIVRKDLVKKENIMKITPSVMNLDTVEKSPEQMLNTPATWSCYITGLYVKYMNKFGLKHFEDLAITRSKMLYDAIDSSAGYYVNKVEPKFRSRQNVVFQMAKGEVTEKKFLADAEKAGLIEVSGHRLVGGLRASLYNAMPVAGVEALVNFMKKFKDENH
jgi:phosphoserine aminotransferase